MIHSAGILVYKQVDGEYRVLLVHPGGPFWGKKESWSVPKGELEADEDLLSGARREFVEELGTEPPAGDLIELGTSKYGGKTNHVWAVEGDVDLSRFDEVRPSNMVTMEWPPHFGRQIEFAENDQVEWFNLPTAYHKVFKNQQVFIERLAAHFSVSLEADNSGPETSAQQTLL